MHIQALGHLQASKLTSFPQVLVLQADNKEGIGASCPFLPGHSYRPAGSLRSRTSHATMSYLIKDILVFGQDRPGEEVLNDTEVQDLVTNGHANPWSQLGGRWHG